MASSLVASERKPGRRVRPHCDLSEEVPLMFPEVVVFGKGTKGRGHAIRKRSGLEEVRDRMDEWPLMTDLKYLVCYAQLTSHDISLLIFLVLLLCLAPDF